MIYKGVRHYDTSEMCLLSIRTGKVLLFFSRHQVYEACRGFQSVFGEARERAIKALAFAKTLRKDLEVSAEFTVISKEALIQRLQDTGHIKVVAPHSSQHQIFIPGGDTKIKSGLCTRSAGHAYSCMLCMHCCMQCRMLVWPILAVKSRRCVPMMSQERHRAPGLLHRSLPW